MSSIINFSNTTPAAPSGASNVSWQWDGTSNLSGYVTPPIVIGFYITSGATGTTYAPPAPRAGSVIKCKVLTIASDGSTDLTFQIKKNGTNVFTSSQTIPHGTAAGTITTITALTSSPLSIAADDIFTLVISSGTTTWAFTAQLE